MIRAALYARCSPDQQREASIEDQLRLCRIHADKQGWVVAESYHDRAVSGASLIRPGIQALLADDVAGVFKRMAFVGVKIITLSEGEITHLHIGPQGHDGCAVSSRTWPTRPGAACAAASRQARPATDFATATTW